LNATDSSQQEQTPSRQDLEVELQDAIRLEQYKKAAELRDTLKSLQPQDTAFSLKKKLDAFVAEERFEVTAATGLLCLNFCGACFLPHVKLAMTAGQGCASQTHWRCLVQEAAAVRDELRSVVAHNIEEARTRTSSDAVTEGVRVQVKR